MASCLIGAMLFTGLPVEEMQGTAYGESLTAEAYTAETQESGTSAGTDAAAKERGAVLETATPSDSGYDPALLHIDETLYVNLDYYGAAKEVNVVKGLTTSKDMRYTDHGAYTAVLNMSDDKPLLKTKDGLSLELEGNGKKFFFQGTLDPASVSLPWSIEVSYKLNGVPVEAEALSGASGVVEVTVSAVPNEAADPYLKNNMLLSVLIPADKTVYSVDAPGSQTQSVGDVTGVVFTALPGEEKTFTARLGTEDYASVGVVVMMMPATLDSFDNITELRELRDTWKESGDAMYDSLDALLSATSSLRTEAEGLKTGLESAENAREKLSSARDGIFSATDDALVSVTALSDSVQKLIPYLATAQTGLSELHTDLNAVVGTLDGMKGSLETIHRGLTRLENGMYGAQYDLSDLTKDVDQLLGDQKKLKGELQKLYEKLEELWGQYQDAEDLPEEEDAEDSSEEEDADSLSAEEDSGTDEAGSLPEQIKKLLEQIREKRKQLDAVAESAGDLGTSLKEVLNGGGKTAQGASYAAEDLSHLIDRTEDLQDTLNTFYPDLQAGLSESQNLLSQLGDTMNRSAAALGLSHEAVKNASGDTDQALTQGLSSSISALEKSLAVFDSLDGIQEAGQKAKEALDKEMDQFDSENHFLDMDPEAEKLSFTSGENKEPDSLQIIMRTDEIKKEDTGTEVLDAEETEAEQGLLERIGTVFVRIFEAIRDIFASL